MIRLLKALIDSFSGLIKVVFLFYDFVIAVYKIGMIAGLSYVISMILVDFPSSLIEAVLQRSLSKKVRHYLKIGITIFLAGLFAEACSGSIL